MLCSYRVAGYCCRKFLQTHFAANNYISDCKSSGRNPLWKQAQRPCWILPWVNHVLLGDNVCKRHASFVLFQQCTSSISCLWTKQPPQHGQHHLHHQPQQQERKRNCDLHQVEDGWAKAAEDTCREKCPKRHTGVEQELGEHEGVLSASVMNVRVERLALCEECCNPHGQLKEAGEENDDAADLDGLKLVLRAARKFMC